MHGIPAGGATVLRKQIAVTIGALVAARALAHVPLPGLDAALIDAIGNAGGAQAPERLSVAALGVIPWFSAALLFELVVLIAPPLRESRFARDGHVDPFHPAVIGLGLVIAAAQAYGIVGALEAFGAGNVDGMAAASALVAGSAIMAGLAYAVQRVGIGHGFWAFFAIPFVIGAGTDARQSVELLRSGYTGTPAFVLAAAAHLAAYGIAAWLLVLRRRAGVAGFQDAVWPLILAAAGVAWLPALMLLVGEDWGLANEPGIAGYAALAVHCALIALLVWAYAWGAGRGLLGPAAAALIAITLISTAIAWYAAWTAPLNPIGVLVLAGLAAAILRPDSA
jgi:hypothetical protein